MSSRPGSEPCELAGRITVPRPACSSCVRPSPRTSAVPEAGDEVIFPNPGFPIYESMIDYVGARAVPIRLREERDFSFDVDELASLISDRTRLIILNSPQNPTGGVLSQRDIH